MVDDYYPDSFDVSSRAYSLLDLSVRTARSLSNKIYFLGREVDYSPIKKLSELIEDVAEKITDPKTERSIDPMGVHILWETLRKYEENKDIQNIKELAPKVASIAQELRDIDNLPKEKLKSLGDFCLSLNIEISKYIISGFKLIAI